MTWSEISSILFHELAKCTSGIVARQADSLAQYEAQHMERTQACERYSEDIDIACRQFSEHRMWPRLSVLQAELVAIRLNEASAFVDFLERDIEIGESLVLPAPTLSNYEVCILEYLLVDYWAFAGRFRWLAQGDRLFYRGQ